jgi:hypothetical protein
MIVYQLVLHTIRGLIWHYFCISILSTAFYAMVDLAFPIVLLP